MKFFSVFIVFVFISVLVEAQEETPVKTGGFELRIGINTFGPVHKMDKLMVENDFDETTANWFSGNDIKHPYHDPIGFTAQLAWSEPLNERRNIGFILNWSYLRQVTGYSLVAEWLTVSFSSFSLAFPVYGFELKGENEGIELQAGPAVMLNLGKETGTGQFPENYSKISAGISAGSTILLWNRKVTYGKLGIQLMGGIPVKMGPYVAENFWGDSDEIPESRYWFGSVNLAFSFGFHL